MKIGIIGNAKDKFTEQGALKALDEINRILDTFDENDILVSGRCPLGGIDVWAEELAIQRNIKTDIKAPKQFRWDAEYGYKQRNLDIARESDVLHVIVVSSYPESFRGHKFDYCYHCSSILHVKSGACWTANRAREFGNQVFYNIIYQ